jgi:hypothetical protein
MAEQRTTPEAIQRSAGEHPVMRVDNVLLSRGERRHLAHRPQDSV